MVSFTSPLCLAAEGPGAGEATASAPQQAARARARAAAVNTSRRAAWDRGPRARTAATGLGPASKSTLLSASDGTSMPGGRARRGAGGGE